MRHILLSILIILIAFTTTPPASADKTTSQEAVVWLPIGHKAMVWPPMAKAIAKANILLGQDYFQTTHQAIQDAKESIYVAMYLINVEPTPTNNPASILLESLINAQKRGVYVKVILDDTKFSINYNAYGVTEEGRYLFIAFVVIKGPGRIRVITARDMSEKEKHYYKKRKGVK